MLVITIMLTKQYNTKNKFEKNDERDYWTNNFTKRMILLNDGLRRKRMK